MQLYSYEFGAEGSKEKQMRERLIIQGAVPTAPTRKDPMIHWTASGKRSQAALGSLRKVLKAVTQSVTTSTWLPYGLASTLNGKNGTSFPTTPAAAQGTSTLRCGLGPQGWQWTLQ